MEILNFTIVGAVLYLGSDWVLNRIEEARGARFPHRSLVFFGIILCSSLLVFSCMRQLSAPESQPVVKGQPAPMAPPVTQK
ncbi:MAG: hypothetical protein H7839_07755 [Magnetococcus sp. YQC-5]